VFSRLLSNARSVHPGLQFHGAISLRYLTTLLVNTHLVCRGIKLRQDVIAGRRKFETYSQWKQALNDDSSMRDWLEDNVDLVGGLIDMPPKQRKRQHDSVDSPNLSPVKAKRTHYNVCAALRDNKPHRLLGGTLT
jgi:hypothetical protein